MGAPPGLYGLGVHFSLGSHLELGLLEVDRVIE